MTPTAITVADLVETRLEDRRWADQDIGHLAETACQAVLASLNIAPTDFEISLLACDDSQIAALNGNFRGKPAATNVLSWPAFDLAADQAGGAPFGPSVDPMETPTGLGDIAIAYDTCLLEANQQNLTFKAHLTHLLVHGCLHLLGYDHVLEKDAVIMEGLEVKVLEKLGVADPY